MKNTMLFEQGENGSHTYRIPALLATQAGSLLAFCEARWDGSGDAGDIDIVMKRSVDGGENWSESKTVWQDKGKTCGNPAPVQDRETGTIFLAATRNLGEDSEYQIIEGTSQDTRRVFVLESRDDGETWSAAREITRDVKQDDWSWYATGPGSGIQIAAGEYEGRIVIPCDHIEKQSKGRFSHVIYSDDHGKSWSLGGRPPSDGVNECMVAELPGGKLVLNMRNHSKTKRNRAVSISNDGGKTWSELSWREELIEPICQAGLINYAQGDSEKGNWLLFSNPASTENRERMSVRLSRDGGATWPGKLLLEAGPSGYSDLAVLPDGRIACLYECGDAKYFERLRLSTFSIEDLA